ncbi:MAG: DUF6934 family protein [Cytophagales bacterium]
MNVNPYPLSSDQNNVFFVFKSIGKSKNIVKVIVYTPIGGNRFNLGFGDLNNGEIEDFVISNNGDGSKVLSTVIYSMELFFVSHQDASILIIGSDIRRTKIYNWLICRYKKRIESKFYIFGLLEKAIVPFNENQNFTGFEIKLKPVNFNY